jgi:hypothetical protein
MLIAPSGQAGVPYRQRRARWPSSRRDQWPGGGTPAVRSCRGVLAQPLHGMAMRICARGRAGRLAVVRHDGPRRIADEPARQVTSAQLLECRADQHGPVQGERPVSVARDERAGLSRSRALDDGSLSTRPQLKGIWMALGRGRIWRPYELLPGQLECRALAPSVAKPDIWSAWRLAGLTSHLPLVPSACRAQAGI